MVFVWEDRGDPTLCFEYKTVSKSCTVAEILTKRFEKVWNVSCEPLSISDCWFIWNVNGKEIYEIR